MQRFLKENVLQLTFLVVKQSFFTVHLQAHLFLIDNSLLLLRITKGFDDNVTATHSNTIEWHFLKCQLSTMSKRMQCIGLLAFRLNENFLVLIIDILANNLQSFVLKYSRSLRCRKLARCDRLSKSCRRPIGAAFRSSFFRSTALTMEIYLSLCLL